MRNLNPGYRSLFPNEFGATGQGRNVLVFPDAHIAR
jgi:hypothetical protein